MIDPSRRGGDAWDQKIRRQIRDCALFIPIISVNTQARSEGYFRLEWHIADQRTHLMGRSRAFLVPVCIDDTREVDADVPDSFGVVHWTRVGGGDLPAALVERIRHLLAHEHRPGPSPTRILEPAAVPGLLPMLSVPSDKPSLAVLPFGNMSSDPEQDYFADGMTEELITALSKLSGILVIGRHSVFVYKGVVKDIRDIARELGVRYVLEGTVRRAGSRVRITAQLVEAASGTHVWAERYDREVEDIFALQDDVTRRIVDSLEVMQNPTRSLTVGQRTPNLMTTCCAAWSDTGSLRRNRIPRPKRSLPRRSNSTRITRRPMSGSLALAFTGIPPPKRGKKRWKLR